MKTFKLTGLACGLGLAMYAGGVSAHDIDEAGEPVCIEGDYMMADAQNAPFASANGPGRVIAMNIIDGTPGITVGNPFGPGNAGTDICPDGVVCPGPWKPTGVLSGGENGHAFITSAGQQALTEFHRDGTPIRSVSYKALLGNPTTGPAAGIGAGTLPRPLGTQLMPNGNLIQAICDANFFNAANSDVMGPGESGITFNAFPGPPEPSDNSSYLYFPPVYNTDARQSNSRLLVIDQVTMQVIDEYSRPKEGEVGHDLWGCFAGIMFSDEGMFVSTFHGAAVLQIDWKAGIDNEKSEGVGSNASDNAKDDDYDDTITSFALDKPKNRAKVIGIVDYRLGKAADDPSRRDSLRAISFDESGNIYATDRERSRDCVRGEAPGAVVPNPTGAPPCNPSVFRQRVNIASFGGEEIEVGDDEVIIPGGFHAYNDPTLRRTLALDPGVNVIAGIRMNRMSGVACETVKANAGFYATDVAPFDKGYALEEDLCDVETLMVAASAMNPGEILTGCVGGHPANACFKPGGGVVEYITHPDYTDGGAAYDGATCTGDPTDVAGNQGCAQPVATFIYTGPNSDSDPEVKVDPRMLMIIHEAFGQ